LDLTLKTMEVRLTRDQEAFIRRAIEAGRFGRAEDAVEEALLLWEERERKRAEFLATLDDAKAAIARGEGHVITKQSMRDLATEVKQRGRARLAADPSRPR
jgi:putative addiction module CopG family antidote